MHELTFRTLLYRYFFFDWLFLDVTKGSLLERSAAWRHNQSQAHWLLNYMRRWLLCAVLLYGLGGIVEILIGAPAVSALFYVPSALSVSVNAVIAAAWLGQQLRMPRAIRRRDPPTRPDSSCGRSLGGTACRAAGFAVRAGA